MITAKQKIIHNLSKNILTLQLALEEIERATKLEEEIELAVDSALKNLDGTWSDFKKLKEEESA